MTNDATSARLPAAAGSPRYSESVHFLTDEPTRAAALGLAVMAAEAAGPGVRPKEGETIRILLEERLGQIRGEQPTVYAAAIKKGRAFLAARKVRG